MFEFYYVGHSYPLGSSLRFLAMFLVLEHPTKFGWERTYIRSPPRALRTTGESYPLGLDYPSWTSSCTWEQQSLETLHPHCGLPGFGRGFEV